VLVHR